MFKLFLVGIGGAAGALLRYAVSGLAYRVFGESFPWGTFAVIAIGCFFIGLLWASSEQTALSPGFRIFFLVGILGAFTTFSTYGLETLNLFRDGQTGLALANILGNNVVGLVAVAAGFFFARLILPFGGAT